VHKGHWTRLKGVPAMRRILFVLGVVAALLLALRFGAPRGWAGHSHRRWLTPLAGH
jgi:hypothetical protein